MPITRIAAFVDGYNLYHGINDTDDGAMRCWLWVDLHELVRRIAPKDSTEIVAINYYSAQRGTQGSRDRQAAFIAANQELHRKEFRPVMGFMKAKEPDCMSSSCLLPGTKWVEKRSDVNLAVDMVLGATKPAPDYDMAVLITGDADQVRSVEAVQEAGRKVIVAFPPGRYSDELRDACSIETQNISSTRLRQSQMQDEVVVGGWVARRPTEWPARPGSFPESTQQA